MPDDKAPARASESATGRPDGGTDGPAGGTGINRKGRKFDQVLEGARKVFLAEGFDNASVDDIAQAAGVSKATLYNYFHDKALLFTEVARCECDRMAQRAISEIDQSAPVREVLISAALSISRMLLSPVAQAMFRICVTERDRFPDLAADYYRSGPEMGRRHLEQHFREAVAHGELRIEKFDIAAEQFIDLARTRVWLRAMLGVQAEFSPEELQEIAEEAVETFLARYGTGD